MRITKENNEDMNVAAAFVSWPVTKLLRIDWLLLSGQDNLGLFQALEYLQRCSKSTSRKGKGHYLLMRSPTTSRGIEISLTFSEQLFTILAHHAPQIAQYKLQNSYIMYYRNNVWRAVFWNEQPTCSLFRRFDPLSLALSSQNNYKHVAKCHNFTHVRLVLWNTPYHTALKTFAIMTLTMTHCKTKGFAPIAMVYSIKQDWKRLKIEAC